MLIVGSCSSRKLLARERHHQRCLRLQHHCRARASCSSCPAPSSSEQHIRMCDTVCWSQSAARMHSEVETSVCGRALRRTCTVLPSISCFFVSPAGCCSKLLGVELLPMMLLASQELSARVATHDQHLQGGAQPFVPETTSNIWVLTWQRPLKTVRGCILYC